MIYNQINQQTAARIYQDIYLVLCWMSVCMIFCVFLLHKNRPGHDPPQAKPSTRNQSSTPPPHPEPFLNLRET